MDEVRLAYKLDARWIEENRRLKYRTIPPMVCCLVVLILNIPLGASAVDRGNWMLPGGHELSPSTLHLAFAVLTLIVNMAVNVREYRAIDRNGELIQEVVQEVRRIRQEHGLPT
jgi:xanthine/uracil permease